MADVIRFRSLLAEMVLRDLTVRYRGSILGVAWTLLNPLFFMVIYTLVFSTILRMQIPAYPLFLLSGLIPWTWFSGAIGQSTTSIVEGRMYVGKTLMPAEILVIVPVLSNGVNFIIMLALLLPASLFFGVHLSPALGLLPLLIMIELFLILGISLVVSAANVFFRDVQQIVSYALMAGFFLTPIFYAASSVPQNLRFLVLLNPVACLVSAYRSIFYLGAMPEWSGILLSSAISFALLLLGLAYFKSARDALGEEL